MIKIIRAALGLHRDRSGQFTFIAMFGAIPFVMLMVQIINLGSVSLDRMRAQNAADAIAQSHAVWTARSLNNIAANNTTMVQSATVAVSSAALHGGLVEAGVHAGAVGIDIGIHTVQHCVPIAQKAASTPWPFNIPIAAMAAACFAEHALAAVPAIDTAIRVFTVHRKYEPDHGLKTANRVTRSLSAANQKTVDRAQEEIGRLVQAAARANGATDFYIHRDCSDGGSSCSVEEGTKALPLPLEHHALEVPEFCLLSNGELLGFGINVAQLRDILGYSTFGKRDYARAETPYTHGGSDEYAYIPDHIVALTKVSHILYAFDNMYRDTKPLGTKALGGFVYLPALITPVLVARYYINLGEDVPESSQQKINESESSIDQSNEEIDNLGDIDFDEVDEEGNPIHDAGLADQVSNFVDQIEDLNPFADEVTQFLLHLREQKPPEDRDNNFFSRLTLEWGLLCLVGAIDNINRDVNDSSSNQSTSGSGIDLSSVTGFVSQLLNFGLEPVEHPNLFFLKDRDFARDFLNRIVRQDDSEFSVDYKPLVFVYHEPTLRVGARHFFGLPERGAFAVAEAITYNTAGFDLYSQEWDGRLTGISQFDDMTKINQSMDQLAEGPFDKLRAAYADAVAATSSTESAFGEIHAH